MGGNMTRYGVLIDGRRGGYGVVFPDLPGCTVMGRTLGAWQHPESSLITPEAAILHDCFQPL